MALPDTCCTFPIWGPHLPQGAGARAASRPDSDPLFALQTQQMSHAGGQRNTANGGGGGGGGVRSQASIAAAHRHPPASPPHASAYEAPPHPSAYEPPHHATAYEPALVGGMQGVSVVGVQYEDTALVQKLNEQVSGDGKG